MAENHGGKVLPSSTREYGRAILSKVDNQFAISKDLSVDSQVWMSHGDTIKEVPEHYKIFASTEKVEVAGYVIEGEQTFGVQFHPEVYHSTEGKILIKNYVVDIELIKILIVFFIGSVIGLIVLSKFLSLVLKKYPLHLNHLIIGFIVGTLPIVWPWKKVIIYDQLTSINNNFGGVIFILASFIVIIFLNNNPDIVIIDKVTEGQACTCEIGLNSTNFDLEKSISLNFDLHSGKILLISDSEFKELICSSCFFR